MFVIRDAKGREFRGIDRSNGETTPVWTEVKGLLYRTRAHAERTIAADKLDARAVWTDRKPNYGGIYRQ